MKTTIKLLWEKKYTSLWRFFFYLQKNLVSGSLSCMTPLSFPGSSISRIGCRWKRENASNLLSLLWCTKVSRRNRLVLSTGSWIVNIPHRAFLLYTLRQGKFVNNSFTLCDVTIIPVLVEVHHLLVSPTISCLFIKIAKGQKVRTQIIRVKKKEKRKRNGKQVLKCEKQVCFYKNFLHIRPTDPACIPFETGALLPKYYFLILLLNFKFPATN